MVNAGTLGFSQRNNLLVEQKTLTNKREGCVFGVYRGLNFTVASFHIRNTYAETIVLHGNFAQRIKDRLHELLQTFRQDGTVAGVSADNEKNFAVSLRSLNSPLSEAQIARFADAMADTVQSEVQQMAAEREANPEETPVDPFKQNRCLDCGTTENVRIVRFLGDGIPMMMCPTCAERAKLTANGHYGEAPKDGAVWKGVFLALVCSLVGVAAWILIGMIGFISAIAGFLIAGGAVWGYKKSNAPMNKTALVILIVLTLVMAIVSIMLSYAVSFEIEMPGTFFSAMPMLFEAIQTDSQILGYFLMDVILGIAFTVLGSWAVFAKIAKGDRADYSVLG